MRTIENLVTEIQEANHYFTDQVQKQVNVSLTARNWIIGRYIVEYEQAGDDRASYGDKVLKVLALRLRTTTKGLSETNLKLFRQFYQIYPQIGQTLSDQFRPLVLPGISQTLSDESTRPQGIDKQKSNTVYSNLINKLSFSHFIELFKADVPLKRSFYEIETIKNNWSVRDLQRAMNSMLFERTGLSHDKKIENKQLVPEDVFRNPYVLEFLGLKKNRSIRKRIWNRRSSLIYKPFS